MPVHRTVTASPVVLLALALSCSGSSGNPPAPGDAGGDASSSVDSGAPPDGSAVADATAMDAAPASDAAPGDAGGDAMMVGSCPGQGPLAVAGGANDTHLLTIDWFGTNDGDFGLIKLAGADVRLDDVDGVAVPVDGGSRGALYAIGGGVLYAIDRTVVPVTATRVGDLAIEKLASTGEDLYGSHGTTIYRIVLGNPPTLVPLGSLLDLGGCTGIRDFNTAISGGQYQLDVHAILECGGVTRYTEQTYDPTNTVSVWMDTQPPIGSGPADVQGVGPTNGSGTPTYALGDSLYGVALPGATFNAVRHLSSCNALPAGAFRGASANAR